MSIPIHIIGGYLGAGKTTLINRLLNAESSPPTGIIVNDFGAVNIDASLLNRQTTDDHLIGLTNGCVCCSMQDGLPSALERLRDQTIEHVVLEASGVAMPAKIRQQCHYPGFHPAGVTILVDAHNHARTCQDKYVGQLVREQLRSADLIGISKLDMNPDFALSPPCHVPSCDATADAFPALLWHFDVVTTPTDEVGAEPSPTEFSAQLRSAAASTQAEAIAEWMSCLPDSIYRAKAVQGEVAVHKVGSQVSVQVNRSANHSQDRSVWQIVVIYPTAVAHEIAASQALDTPPIST